MAKDQRFKSRTGNDRKIKEKDKTLPDVAYIKAKTQSVMILASGGIVSLIVGLIVFSSNLEGKDKTVLRFGNFNLSSKHLGALIIANSTIWAFLSYQSRPKYSHLKSNKKLAHKSNERESNQVNMSQPYSNPEISDQEIWNIITYYGKYQEVWSIYRNNGWIEAIKTRDEKVEFDQRMSQLKPPQPPSPSKEVARENPEKSFHNTAQKIDELDLALVRGLASYFEEMPDKIRRYHQDHNASREEAEVIANYYEKTANMIRDIQTENDIKYLLQHLRTLKNKVKRYQHKKDKYRWSTGLEYEVIKKLERIL